MASINIIHDEEAIDHLFKQCFGVHSQRSLKKDYKKCFDKKIDKMKQLVVRDLSIEFEKPLSSFDKLKGIKPQDQVMVVKIRIADADSNKGKQSGFRCIVLIDSKRDHALLLHIYHKKYKKNLSSDDIQDFAKFHRSYLSPIHE
jgi:mRNA-degrading endonuclease RelE of RelBE toxin-antitoxin system